MSKAEIVKQYGTVTELQSGKTSDDTAMALAQARAIQQAGEYMPSLALGNYVHWLVTDGFGAGRTARTVLRAIADGETWQEATQRFHEEYAWRPPSNGAVMRCAPLAIRYHRERDILREFAQADAKLTHYHPLPAACVVQLTAWYADLIEGIRPSVFPNNPPEIQQALMLSKQEAEEFADRQKAHTVVPLAVAVHALKCRSFKDAVIWAANCGGDTDTNAAIAGSLIGARDGIQAIPIEWRERVERVEMIEEVAEALLNQVKAPCT